MKDKEVRIAKKDSTQYRHGPSHAVSVPPEQNGQSQANTAIPRPLGHPTTFGISQKDRDIPKGQGYPKGTGISQRDRDIPLGRGTPLGYGHPSGTGISFIDTPSYRVAAGYMISRAKTVLLLVAGFPLGDS